MSQRYGWRESVRAMMADVVLVVMFVGVLAVLVEPVVWAIDIEGVQNVSLDQPRVNVIVRYTEDGDPLVGEVEDIWGGIIETINIQAFYDTGASGILLSEATADALGIMRQRVGDDLVVFEDVGFGTEIPQFNVAEELYYSLAPCGNGNDGLLDNRYDTSVYSQTFGAIRAQIGPLGVDPGNPLLSGLDVFGMPTMQGKVVVMDPSPLDTIEGIMKTYVYDPGTAFDPVNVEYNPGIPVTNRHVELSLVDFSRFTQTTVLGVPGGVPPTLCENPIIGPDPVGLMEGDTSDMTPGIVIEYGGNMTEGSFLLDTGASASFISKAMAAELGIAYVTGGEPDDPPVLSGVPVEDQFTLAIGGVGGESEVAGFFLDSLLMRTVEGDVLNDDDPDHLRYFGAPVLVTDITLIDPITEESLTLDGVFGMNFLVASMFVDGWLLGDSCVGPYDWVVFDEANGMLGLDVKDFLLPVVGDYNWDGVVDQGDYTVWADSYGQSGAGLAGDGNNDGVVDQADYTLWVDNYGESSSGTAVVPEPSGVVLMLVVSVLGYRRR